MQFKIYKEKTPHKFINKVITWETEPVISPYADYCLVDNDPGFKHGGYFCGWETPSEYTGGHVIAEAKAVWSENEAAFCQELLSRCDYYRSIVFTYTCPLRFDAETVDEARQFFGKVISDNNFDELLEKQEDD